MSSAASRAFLGVDLGTSGLKLSLVGADGAVLAEAEESYQVRAPEPGYAETDPAAWSAALDRACEALAATRARSEAADTPLVAVGVTGQMHGVVLVDAQARPVRPAVLWPDQRAATVLPLWTGLHQDVRSRLGNPLVAGMPGPILTWLQVNEPAVLDAAAIITSPKDWLRSHLTGDRLSERTDASATLLWDVVADTWSREALSLAGVSSERLPTLVASDAVVGTAALALSGPGERVPVPVVAGAADTAAALVALEATGPTGSWSDVLVINVGTGIQLLRPEAAAGARIDPVTHLYADTDGGWYEMLAIQNGGMALSWVQEILKVSWQELVALAKSSSTDSKGVLFSPFLTGERGAIASGRPSAGWSSLTTSTGRPELARSAFDSLAFTIRRGIELLGGHSGPVLLSGGGAREPWFRQLISDVLNRPISHVQLRSASAVGAAVLAARGVGERLPVPAPIVEVTPSREGGDLEQGYTRWLDALTRSETS